MKQDICNHDTIIDAGDAERSFFVCIDCKEDLTPEAFDKYRLEFDFIEPY